MRLIGRLKIGLNKSLLITYLVKLVVANSHAVLIPYRMEATSIAHAGENVIERRINRMAISGGITRCCSQQAAVGLDSWACASATGRNA